MKPWHHLPEFESARDHELFAQWLYAGASPEVLRAVARRAGISVESISLLSAVRCWEQRATAYRTWIASVQDKAAEAEAVSVGRAKVQALKLASAAMDEAQVCLDREREARALHPSTHSRIDPSTALRVALRAPAAVRELAEIMGDEPASDDDLDYSRLTTDELAELQRLQGLAARR